jgi:hypothetical protein
MKTGAGIGGDFASRRATLAFSIAMKGRRYAAISRVAHTAVRRRGEIGPWDDKAQRSVLGSAPTRG